MPRRSGTLVFLVAAIAIAGCGQSKEDEYADDFKPLNDRLLVLGQQIGTGLDSAGDRTNAKLTSQFGRFASDLKKVNRQIADLDPPKELQDESKALVEHTDVVVKDLEDISAAARSGDRKAATRATIAFGRHSPQLNQAQNGLAKATGADPGTR